MTARVVAFMYIDHQDVIGYPVGFCTKDLAPFEALYWLCGDERTAQLLEPVKRTHPLSERITLAVLGHRIRSVADIPAAQNMAADWVRQHDQADFLLLVHADTWVRPAAARAVKEQTDFLITSLPDRRVVTAVPCRRITLFHEAPRSVYGVTLLGRDTTARFIEDGSYTDQQFHGHQMCAWPAALDAVCVEVGYWSVDQYGRHKIQHATTWGAEADQRLAEAYQRDREEFIRMALRRLQTYEYATVGLQCLPTSDPDLSELCTAFDKWDEYAHVAAIAREL